MTPPLQIAAAPPVGPLASIGEPGAPLVEPSVPSISIPPRNAMAAAARLDRAGCDVGVLPDVASDAVSQKPGGREHTDGRRHAIASTLRDANLSEKTRRAREHNERVKRVQEQMKVTSEASASASGQSAQLGKERVQGSPKVDQLLATPLRTVEHTNLSGGDKTSLIEMYNGTSNGGLCKPPPSSTNRLLRNSAPWSGPSESWSAARRIAGYWLLSSSRTTLRDAGLLGTRMVISDFEHTVTTIQKNEVDLAARLALRALGTEPNASPSLLFSFIVAAHPDLVFLDHTGESERSTLLAARRMVLCTQAGTLPALAYAWSDWTTVLAAWKAKEEERLTAAIVTDGIAFEALRESLRRRYSGCQAVLGKKKRPVALRWDEAIRAKLDELRYVMCAVNSAGGSEALEEALLRARDKPADHIDRGVASACDVFLSELKQPRVPAKIWNDLDQELSSTPRRYDELILRLKHIEANTEAITAAPISSVSELRVREDPAAALQLVTRQTVALLSARSDEDVDKLRNCIEDANCLSVTNAGFASGVVRILVRLTHELRNIREKVDTERVLWRSEGVDCGQPPWERSRCRERAVILAMLAGDARAA
jgi:hypothetical protein